MKSTQTSADRAPANSSAEDSSDATGLILKHAPGTYGICRLDARARIPRWVHHSIFFSVSRSPDELSILCEDRLVPDDVSCEPGWSAIRVVGTLDFSLIGVLASLANPLVEAKIGLFTVSTYETDYLLVREKRLDDAIAVLEAAGHSFQQPTDAATTEPERVAPAAGPAPPAPAPTKAAGEPAEAEPEPPAVEARAIEPPAVEPPAVEAPPARKPARKSAFARVLAEFGLGSKDEPEAAAVVEEAEQAAQPVAEAPPAAESPAAETAQAAEVGELEPAAERVLSKPSDLSDMSDRSDSSDQADMPAPAEEPQAEEPPAAAVAETAEPPPETPIEEPPVVAEAEPTEPEPKAAEPVQWQPKPPAKDQPEDADAGARAEGLFTGAIPQHDVEITDQSFEDLGLSGPILDTIREVGFEHPTPIQAKVIPVAEEGFDVIGLAETGSGKTAAFCLPLAERLTHGRGTRGLILCPTREIALQTKSFLDIFGRDHALETVVVIGGVRMGPQIDGFRRDADIIVATPGRLADHMRRRNVSLELIDELVLDEADHMLDLGFLPQIKEILEQVPDDRRTLMFSATMPPPIERLAQQFMRNPVRCDIRPEGQLATGIEHRLYLVKDEDRKDCLLALLGEIEGSTLIFIRRKLYTEWLARQLELGGFPVARIHSDRSQAQRVQALRAFREGKVRILVATDVAARGIDVPRIQHVINYGLPEQVGDYVHRAGRTARGSAAGIVSTIGTWQDKLMVRDIELDLAITMPRCTAEGVEPYTELPKRKTVRRRRLL